MKRDDLLKDFSAVRTTSEELCSPLETEDYVVQSMPDVSPPKWNLAHTTWFFERVILHELVPGYRPYHDRYYYLFNSYYQSLGDRWNRDQRGVVSRPTVSEILSYRAEINRRMAELLLNAPEGSLPDLMRLTELGIHHEQQHQELLLTDIKHIFASNPFRPVYMPPDMERKQSPAAGKPGWIGIEGGRFRVGASGTGFAWDNERPQHEVLLRDLTLMDRLVTCGEYLEFISDGGYTNPLLWLSDAWECVVRERWESPLYWEQVDGEWNIMTLNGLRPLDPNEPVCHVSFYEAHAYARWASGRLPTEAEWEKGSLLVRQEPACGNFLEQRFFHPVAAPAGQRADGSPAQMFGDVWEWTGSAYLPYPGYSPEPGPLGEYNGKFMNNQMVLRGGSCVTPSSHIRRTYRNFFQGEKRWQFTGIRLAKEPAAP